MTKHNTVTIATQKTAAFSAEQKKFRRLSEQISQEKNLAKEWLDHIERYKQLYAVKLQPLILKYNALQSSMVYLLDTYCDNTIFSAVERKKILNIILIMAENISAIDDKAKDIYHKRSSKDYNASPKMAGENYNINADEIDPVEQNLHHINHAAKNTKTQLSMNQSLKDVYRQLVKISHPDTEMDNTKHVQKTELMQQINTAYKKSDLLTLLQIQSNAAQTCQSNLKTQRPNKIKQYNIILAQQLEEMRSEINHIREDFTAKVNMPPNKAKTPKSILYSLNNDISHIKLQTKILSDDLKLFQNKQIFKLFLKTQKKL